MKKFIQIIIPLLLICAKLSAQTKVASFEYGKFNTRQYEYFSFWVKDGKISDITYTYGKSDIEIPLTYLGKDVINGIPCFKVQFKNGYMLYVSISRINLKITDQTGSYNKIFTWAYEGPVNGIGTFCAVCADDGNDAIALIRQFYMQ